MASSAATPLPSSLIPGPSGTESRCAPAIATRSPLPVSASTLAVLRSSDTASTATVARPASRRRLPAAEETKTAGIRRPGAPSVPAMAPVRPGPPSLATSTAPAPAACALRAFSRSRQPPRRTSATSPSRSAPKSAGLQPAPASRTAPDARPSPE